MALTIGGQTALASHTYGRGFGGGVTEIYFDYDVQADDFDADGISIAANAILLNGATVNATINATDGATAAVLTHSAVPADSIRRVGDGSAPPPQPPARR